MLPLKAFTQKSMSEKAIAWKPGEYDRYNFNETESKFELRADKANIEIVKDEAGEVKLVKSSNVVYKFWDKDQTNFVRSYSTLDGWHMYFTDKSIVLYSIGHKVPQEVKLKGCIGKKVSPKIIGEIEEFLKATQNEYVPEAVFSLDEYIDSVRVVVLTKDKAPPSADKRFDIGYIVKFKWGKYAKTENLGGKMVNRAFEIKSPGLIYYDRAQEKEKYELNCKLEPNEEVTVTLRARVASKIFTCKLDIPCNSGNSITLNRIRRWSNYDEIGFTIFNRDMKFENRILTNEGSGFGAFSADIDRFCRKSDPKNKFVRVKKNGKYGYTDSTGTIIIPIEYDAGEVGQFDEKLIPVKKGNNWGIINEKNKTVINFDYEKINAFVNGLAVIVKSGKYGCINTAGKIVLAANYDYIGNFTDAKVAIAAQGGKYGLIDNTGKVIAPFEHEKIRMMNSHFYFNVTKGNMQGILSDEGKLVLPIEYNEIYAFSEGYAIVKQNGRYGYFGNKGKMITECKYDVAEKFYGLNGKVQIHEINGGVKTIRKGWVYGDGTEKWDDDATVTSNTDNNQVYNNNKTSNTSKKDGGPKTCTILNDLKPEQVNKYNNVRLVFDSYRIASQSLQRGKSMEVDCDDVVVWAGEFEDQNGSKKTRKLFTTKGRCGETIKLSEYW